MGLLQNSNAIPTAAEAGFYTHQIANSLRFPAGANGYLSNTSLSAGNRRTWTYSIWTKKNWINNTTNGERSWLSGYSTGGATYAFWGFQGHSSNAAHMDDFKFEETSGSTKSAFSIDDGDERKFRDPSAWYHVVLAIDTTQSTATDRQKVWINGEAQTLAVGFQMAEDYEFSFINNGTAKISQLAWSDGLEDTQLADYIFLDGVAADADDFGETKNGVWIPKEYSGSYGNEGYHLKFEDSSDLGNDSSGNNNDFSVTNLSAHDQLLDSPTFNSSSNGGNFATLNPLNTRGSTAVATQLSEGNLKWTPGATQDETSGTMSIGAGGVDKVYIEVYCENNSDTGWFGVYDQKDGNLMESVVQSVASAVRFKPRTGQKVTAGTSSNYIGDGSESNPSGVIFQMAVDVSAGKIWWGRNNAWGSDGEDHIDDDNVAFTTLNTDGTYLLFTHTGGASVAQPDWVFNFGQDGTFAGNKTAQGNSDDTGYGDFYYDPPTGFLALCSGNASVATDPAEEEGPNKYFVPKLYTGDGTSTLAITGLEFQPDFTWIKNRDQTDAHNLYNSTLGVTKYLQIDNNAALTTNANTLKSWTSDGFTVGDDVIVNTNTEKYVSWNWKATGGTTATNNDGNVETTIQADSDRGFSIIKWTGTGTNSRTLGHGLTKEPEVFMVKRTENTQSWNMWHSWANDGSEPGTQGYFSPQSSGAYTAGSGSLTYWYPAGYSSTTVGVGGASGNNNSGEVMIGWAWHSVDGFSKFSGYEGNGNANGTFVYLGFRPSLIIIKSTSSTGDWLIFDDQRKGFNPDNNQLVTDATTAEATSDMIDMLSNGFKCRISTYPNVAETYAYLAWAENPFKYATAR